MKYFISSVQCALYLLLYQLVANVKPSSQASEVPKATEPQRRNPTRVASTRPIAVVPSARPVERVASTRPCAMVLSAPVPRIVLTSTPMDEVLPNNPGTDR